jgi:hypothetical protein
MSTANDWSLRLRDLFAQPRNGAAGLADDLLALCREHRLELTWQAGRCRARRAGEAWQEVEGAALRASVVRAILARLAELCKERSAGSCSPYGGRGEIRLGPDPAAVLHVEFVNTPGEQRLQVTAERAAMPAGVDREAHPMLAALLDAVPRLRREGLLPWAEYRLVPILRGFREDSGPGETATALDDLRVALRSRADVEPWLGDIARLGEQQYAGTPMRLDSPGEQPRSVELSHDVIKNRTHVILARQIVAELTGKPARPPDDEAHPSQVKPDEQS